MKPVMGNVNGTLANTRMIIVQKFGMRERRYVTGKYAMDVALNQMLPARVPVMKIITV